MNDLLCRYILNLNKIVDEFFKHSNIKQAMTKFLKKMLVSFLCFLLQFIPGIAGAGIPPYNRCRSMVLVF